METETEFNYFLEHPAFGSKEVTYEEWVTAGGRFNKDFSLNGVNGSCQPKKEEPYKIYKLHPDRVTLRDVLTEKGIL